MEPNLENQHHHTQQIFMLSQHKNRKQHKHKKARRDSRMYLVDGQRLAWSDEPTDEGHLHLFRTKRNSSVATTSPADGGGATGSSLDISTILRSSSLQSSSQPASEEVTSHRIRWCRESITQLKCQTWSMERKLQTLRACKLFIKQHQGELTQSNQMHDLLTSANVVVDHYWRYLRRELANFLVIITPWEMRIKKIESHFGSVVASYFTFLRWIFWLNLANSLVLICFVLVPELIENFPDATGMRKGQLGMLGQPLGDDGQPTERPDFNPTLVEILEFEGFLKYSPIFYGFYSNREISKWRFWRNPLAYLLSIMLTYLLCVFCISRKLSQNNKLSRAGAKEEEYIFSWTVFVGWDYMIGNAETAYNKTSSLVMNLKEGILEEKEQVKDRDWRLIMRRVLANVISFILIVSSAFVVGFAVQRSENLPDDANLFQKNELQLVMSGIQFIFPPLFDVIGFMEGYHPRKALNWQLFRILSLDFLNFYTLMFALIGSVGQMGHQLNEVANNMTLMRYNSTHYHRIVLAKNQSRFYTNEGREFERVSIPFHNATGANSTPLTNISRPTSSIIFEEAKATPVSISDPSLFRILDQNLKQTALQNPKMSINTTFSEQTSPSTRINETATTDIAPMNIDQTTMNPETTSSSPNNNTKPPDKELSVSGTRVISSTTTGEPTTIIDSDYADLSQLESSERLSIPSKRFADDETETQPPTITSVDSELGQFVTVLPPIRDPYGSLGTNSGRAESKLPLRSEQIFDDEPLEGRLQVDNAPKYPSSSTTSQPQDLDYLSTIMIPIESKDKQASPDTPNLDRQANPKSNESVIVTQSPILLNTNANYTTITYNVTELLPLVSGETTTTIRTYTNDTIDPLQFMQLFNISLDDNSSFPSLAMLKSNSSHALIGVKDANYDPQSCVHIPSFESAEILALNETFRDKLQSLCWETMFGQEMVKIVVTDLVMTVISAIAFEFLRACFVRYCNRFFFWDLERGLPGYQDFKIAENVLHLVNNQSTVWMGMFFAPGLPAINTVKLAVLMYVRSWAVLTCNIPHETVFKVSKSNNFYYLILLLNLIICIMPVAYAVTWIRPSWHCGPFGGQCRMYVVLTKLMDTMLPPGVNAVIKYLSSPGTIIPLIILLVLIIYYLTSTLGATKESNKDLKAQLKKNKDENEREVTEITTTQTNEQPNQVPATDLKALDVVDGAKIGLPIDALDLIGADTIVGAPIISPK